MIVSMDRVTLICLASDRDRSLKELQKMGVVHVTNLQIPDHRDLDVSRHHLMQVRRVTEMLPKKSDRPPSGLDADVVVSILWTLLQERKEIEDELTDLRQEARRIQPFGAFRPDQIRDLADHGVFVKLVQASPDKPVTVPDGWVAVTVHETKESRYLACVGRTPGEIAGGVEVRLPEQSLTRLRERISELEARLAENAETMRVHDGDGAVIRALEHQLEERVQFLDAREGMGSVAPIAYLRGYAPSDAAPRLLEAAKAQGWGITLETPDPSEDVPTLIRNPKWVKPIRAVLEGINILPGYREVDISAAFLIFLSLFFAILIGDAGYGALFIGLTWFARRKAPKAPAYIFHLLYLTSVCTVVWGTITGTWFGAERLPALLESAKVGWLGSDQNLMKLCFFIGAIHLTLAHVWNALRFGKRPATLAQVGWIGTTWSMFFAARNMVLGEAYPPGIGWLFAGSVLLILLFMTPPAKFKEEWFNHVMLPLNLVSNFVDVVSYLRLFAVGSASFAVAAAFNKMALGGGVDGILGGFLAAFILFAGHGLNIVLGAMGILVHGVRLNTLEFSSHLGMQWAGFPYAPLARKRDVETDGQP